MTRVQNASATLTASDDGDASAVGGTFLYLLLEYRRPAAGGARWAIEGIDEVKIGRGAERRTVRDGSTVSIEVPDGRMSTRHARLARLAGGWAFEDLGSKNGSRVQGVATKRAPLKDGDLIEIAETMFLFREEASAGAADLASAEPIAPGLATLSPVVAAEYERLAAVAASDVPVLLLGETGTGKEVAARALHSLSKRKGRFVAVNCGALPAALVEAELFGHRHGSFSGSTESRPGLVRSADHGTLFLDEIADLALPSQAALLRVLQEKEITPVGETVPTRVDVRIVAATHHDVRSLCDKGRFREDLLARLDGYATRLAPLRERRADLGILIAALLQRIAPGRAERIAFHSQAGRALASYDWPRNVRELEQALGAAVALAKDDVVTLSQLPERVREGSGAAGEEAPARVAPESLSPDDMALRAKLTQLLEEQHGNINAVARLMVKDRTQIKRWIARFGLDPERFR